MRFVAFLAGFLVGLKAYDNLLIRYALTEQTSDLKRRRDAGL